jgi:beta-glucosidase-like glycosyl hydrolase
VITDDLNTSGVTHFLPTPDAAVHAVAAGVDMVLTAGLPREADRNSTAVYSALVAAATNKTLSRRRVAEAYAHVLRAEARLGRRGCGLQLPAAEAREDADEQQCNDRDASGDHTERNHQSLVLEQRAGREHADRSRQSSPA